MRCSGQKTEKSNGGGKMIEEVREFRMEKRMRVTPSFLSPSKKSRGLRMEKRLRVILPFLSASIRFTDNGKENETNTPLSQSQHSVP